MDISHRIENNICIVSLRGKTVRDCLHGSLAQEITDYVAPLLKEKVLGVVLNFGNIDHVSSGEIGDIVSFFHFLRDRKIKLVLCHMNEKLAMLFNMTDLDRVIQTFPTEQEALISFH